MRCLRLLLLTASLSEYTSAYTGGRRDICHDYDGHIADMYDFTIVGECTASLAITSSLSEASKTTVLVREASDTDDTAIDAISTSIYVLASTRVLTHIFRHHCGRLLPPSFGLPIQLSIEPMLATAPSRGPAASCSAGRPP